METHSILDIMQTIHTLKATKSRYEIDLLLLSHGYTAEQIESVWSPKPEIYPKTDIKEVLLVFGFTVFMPVTLVLLVVWLPSKVSLIFCMIFVLLIFIFTIIWFRIKMKSYEQQRPLRKNHSNCMADITKVEAEKEQKHQE